MAILSIDCIVNIIRLFNTVIGYCTSNFSLVGDAYATYVVVRDGSYHTCTSSAVFVFV